MNNNVSKYLIVFLISVLALASVWVSVIDFNDSTGELINVVSEREEDVYAPV